MSTRITFFNQKPDMSCCYTGISLQDIKTYILHNYSGVDPNTLKVRVAEALDDCLQNGLIHRPGTSSEKPEVLNKAGFF